MTDKQKLELVKKCYEDIIWMAIRYADGRHTYAPDMVRNSIERFKSIFPNFELQEDKTLIKKENIKIDGFTLESDYLWDLVNTAKND